MSDEFKTYNEVLKELQEVKGNYESLKKDYSDLVEESAVLLEDNKDLTSERDLLELELEDLKIIFNDSIDSNNKESYEYEYLISELESDLDIAIGDLEGLKEFTKALIKEFKPLTTEEKLNEYLQDKTELYM